MNNLAEEIYREALALSESVIGKEHPSTLTNMNNLAVSQGKYKEAEKIYRQVLALSTRQGASIYINEYEQPSSGITGSG